LQSERSTPPLAPPSPTASTRSSKGWQTVIERDRPEEVAIEDVFFAANVKSALKLGHVRGVAMLAASCAGLAVAEYARSPSSPP